MRDNLNSLTFVEAYELLNVGQTGAVAARMAGWHPALLGAMLEAVAEAKRTRYPGEHGGYTDSLCKVFYAELGRTGYRA